VILGAKFEDQNFGLILWLIVGKERWMGVYGTPSPIGVAPIMAANKSSQIRLIFDLRVSICLKPANHD
jgi:hypothetical protein